MLAEIFQENVDVKETWISCFHFIENNEIFHKINFSAKLGNIFLLYEHFFEEKVLKYFLQDKKIVDLSKPSAEDIIKYYLPPKKETHKFYGFIALCGNNRYADFISTKETEIQNKSREGIEKIGIIDSFNSDNHPLFTHLTYAEYFCAAFLVDKLCTLHFPAEKVFEAINEILKKDVPVFVKCLLHRMKEEINNQEFKNGLNGNSILKFVIKNELFNCVVVFLNNEDFNDGFLNSNESNKNISHYAAEFGSFNIFIYIILFLTDTLLRYRKNETDFFPDLFYYLFESNEFIFDNAKCEKIRLFLKDALIVSANHLKRKNINDIDIKTKVTNTFKPSEYIFGEIEIPTHFFSYLSFESIVNIINISEHRMLWIKHFTEICFRNDLTIKEKLKIFHLMTDNKDASIKDMLNIIVKSECCDFLREIFKEDTFKVTPEIQESLLKTAVECNFHEIVRFLFDLFENNESPKVEGLLDLAWTRNVNFKILELLMKKTKLSLNSALVTAIQNGCNIKKINYLIQNGADPFKENECNKSPWKIAVEKADDEIIKYFLSKFDTIKNDSYHKKTDNLGLEFMIKIVKEYFEDPFKFKSNQNNYFFQAIDDKDNALCHFLLQKKINVNIIDKNGKSPLYLAWENKMTDIVRLLLFYGATYNEKDQLSNNRISLDENIQKYTNNERQTLWHFAAKSGDFKKIDELISISAIDNKDMNGNTALHFAVQSGNFECVRKILKRSACYNIKNNEGKSPNDLVNNNEEINKLFKNILDVFELAEKNIFDSSLKYQIYEIIKVKNEMGRTLLHYAVLNKNIAAVKVVLYKYADITIKDNEKRTPLYYAVKDDSYMIVKEMMRMLMKKNILTIEYTTDNYFDPEETPFDVELYKDIPENKCTILLSCITKCLNHVFNEEIEELITLLDLIEDNKEFNIVVTAMECQKKSVFEFATSNYELTKYLLQKGIMFKSKNFYFKIIFHNLRIEKALQTLQELNAILPPRKIEPGSLINYCKKYVKNTLCVLLFIDDEIIADKIIANIRIDGKREYGFETRHFVHIFPIRGGTLLHLAAAFNEEIIVQWLVEIEPDLTAKDHDGRDVYEIAEIFKSNKVLQILPPKKQ